MRFFGSQRRVCVRQELYCETLSYTRRKYIRYYFRYLFSSVSSDIITSAEFQELNAHSMIQCLYYEND